jgi:hypothetical protein
MWESALTWIGFTIKSPAVNGASPGRRTRRQSNTEALNAHGMGQSRGWTRLVYHRILCDAASRPMRADSLVSYVLASLSDFVAFVVFVMKNTWLTLYAAIRPAHNIPEEHSCWIPQPTAWR